jgi:hypothetical protein
VTGSVPQQWPGPPLPTGDPPPPRPPNRPAGAAAETVAVVLPAGLADAAVTIGPDDILVLRVAPHADLDDAATKLLTWRPPTLEGRVLVVAADQIGVIRG